MTQENFNEVLFFFYRNQGEHQLTKSDFTGFNEYPIIEELVNTGILNKRSDSKGRWIYWMSTKGNQFMETMPEIYYNNPYQHYLKSFNVLKNPLTDTTSNTTPSRPKIRSYIEMIGWIIGIIVGLLAIYEFILKHIFKTQSLF